MNEAIQQMLERYGGQTRDDHVSDVSALREILQQIALLGLWRSKFLNTPRSTAAQLCVCYTDWTGIPRIWIFRCSRRTRTSPSAPMGMRFAGNWQLRV